MNATVNRTAHIVIADDDPDDQEMVKQAIEESGLPSEVIVVDDGAQLIEFLEDPEKRIPDLVLLDINMPRMGGFDALKKIKSNPTYKPLPIIMLTTSNSQEDIIRGYQLDCNSYISKPILYETLVDLMRTLRSYWVDYVEHADIQQIIERGLGKLE